MENEQPWLTEYTWDQVIRLNSNLCEAQKVDCKLTPKASKAEAIWNKAHAKSSSLLEALDLCKRCNDFRPFLFNCSNTFTKLGTDLIEGWACQLSSVEAHMLRQTTGHFVDGQVHRKELINLLTFIQKRPIKPIQQKTKTPSAPTPQPAASEPEQAQQPA